MWSRLKNYIKEKNREGRWLWVEAAYKLPGSFYRFPSFKRVFNWIEYRGRALFGSGYASFSGHQNGAFYDLISHGTSEQRMIRIPRLGQAYECALRKTIKGEKGYADFRNSLTSLTEHPHLGRHFPEVRDVRRDGGYSITLVKGYSLDLLRNWLRDGHALPTDLNSAQLGTAIENLQSDLTTMAEERKPLIGRWNLSALIFSAEACQIINVDVESCYLYADGTDQSGVDFLESELGYISEMLRTRTATDPSDIRLRSVLTAVGYPARGEVAYNARSYSVGYHSLSLDGKYFRGQRECATRLASVAYDFRDKTILDLGCNRGGMLHCLADTIRTGVGVDYDYKCVNAANMIRQLNGSDNLNFFTLNLDLEEVTLIDNFLMGARVDICFLLSVCAWIKNWKRAIEFTARTADNLLFESNGTVDQRRNQMEVVRGVFTEVNLVNQESPDDPDQKARSLYLCAGSRSLAQATEPWVSSGSSQP